MAIPHSTDSAIQIQLKGEFVGLLSPEDADLLQVKWYRSSRRKPYILRTNTVSAKPTELLHRIVLARVLERELESHEHVDHINGNPLDNRRENLRLATRSQNMANSTRRSDNTSGYKGVCWDKGMQKWRAGLSVNGKTRYLGCFDSPEQAHAVYLEAAKALHGEFARSE